MKQIVTESLSVVPLSSSLPTVSPKNNLTVFPRVSQKNPDNFSIQLGQSRWQRCPRDAQGPS